MWNTTRERKPSNYPPPHEQRESVEETLLFRAAERELCPADEHGIPPHARDAGEVDEEGGAAPRKVFAAEHLFRLRHGHAHAHLAARGVEGDVVLFALRVEDILAVEGDLPVRRVQEDVRRVAEGAVVQDLFDLCAEDAPGERLCDEVCGPHLVAVDGVLDHVGDKDEAHALVALAQFAGGGQAVQVGHFDIHEHDVRIGAVIADKVHPVRKDADLYLFPALARVPPQKFCELFGTFLFIFDDRDAYHCTSSGMRTHPSARQGLYGIASASSS